MEGTKRVLIVGTDHDEALMARIKAALDSGAEFITIDPEAHVQNQLNKRSPLAMSMALMAASTVPALATAPTQHDHAWYNQHRGRRGQRY